MKDSIKSGLFHQIKEIAADNNLSQRDLAKALQVSQPRISNLLDERSDLFSVDKLLDFMNDLGYCVTIKVEKKETAS